MQDISVAATVRGITGPANHGAIEFREAESGQLIRVAASSDGEFNVRLSECHYDVHHGAAHTGVTVLPGGIYSLDLRPEQFLDFKVTSPARSQERHCCATRSERCGRSRVLDSKRRSCTVRPSRSEHPSR